MSNQAQTTRGRKCSDSHGGVSAQHPEARHHHHEHVSDDLATYAKTRDPALRAALAERHLPLVKYIARKMSTNVPSHIEIGDLVSWGSLGLLDAIEKFNPTLGHAFSTYAVPRIRGSILDGLQQMEWAPKQVTSRVRLIRRTREQLTNHLGYEPTCEQLAAAVAMTPAEVRGILVDDATTRVKTLSGPATNDSGGESPHIEVADLTMWDQELAGEVVELRHRMAVAVNTLGERERIVLTMYYRDGKTLRRIAEELGVSVSSAIQTHTRLVETVRARLATLGGVAGV